MVRRAKEADGRDGECVAVSQDLGSNIPEFESGDAKENAVNAAESLSSSVGRLANATLLVEGRDTAAHGNS